MVLVAQLGARDVEWGKQEDVGGSEKPKYGVA